MELADRVSENLIKIFHNAKGSIVNDVAKWTKDLDAEYKIHNSPLRDEQFDQLDQDLLSNEHEQQYKHR